MRNWHSTRLMPMDKWFALCNRMMAEPVADAAACHRVAADLGLTYTQVGG